MSDFNKCHLRIVFCVKSCTHFYLLDPPDYRIRYRGLFLLIEEFGRGFRFPPEGPLFSTTGVT